MESLASSPIVSSSSELDSGRTVEVFSLKAQNFNSLKPHPIIISSLSLLKTSDHFLKNNLGRKLGLSPTTQIKNRSISQYLESRPPRSSQISSSLSSSSSPWFFGRICIRSLQTCSNICDWCESSSASSGRVILTKVSGGGLWFAITF